MFAAGFFHPCIHLTTDYPIQFTTEYPIQIMKAPSPLYSHPVRLFLTKKTSCYNHRETHVFFQLTKRFIPVQKIVRNPKIFRLFIHSRSRSFKGSLVVRPSTLRTYVQTPLGRTSIDSLNVRPEELMHTVLLTHRSCDVKITLNFHGIYTT